MAARRGNRKQYVFKIQEERKWERLIIPSLLDIIEIENILCGVEEEELEKRECLEYLVCPVSWHPSALT